jgi:hypothetical protein
MLNSANSKLILESLTEFDANFERAVQNYFGLEKNYNPGILDFEKNIAARDDSGQRRGPWSYIDFLVLEVLDDHIDRAID